MQYVTQDSNSLLYTQLQFLCIWAFFVYRAFLVVEFVYDKTHVPRICVHVPSICVQKIKFCVNMHFFGRFFCKVVCGYTSPLYVHRWSMYVYTQDRRALYAKGVRCVHTRALCIHMEHTCTHKPSTRCIHEALTASGSWIWQLKKNLAGGGVSTRTPGSHRAPGQQSTFGIGGMD